MANTNRLTQKELEGAEKFREMVISLLDSLPVESKISIAWALVCRALQEGFPFPACTDGETHAREARKHLQSAILEFGDDSRLLRNLDEIHTRLTQKG